MPNNDLVSIITPSYNSKRFIKDCIDSVRAQIYSEWEMIIVDDCSVDGSADYIKELIKNERRITLIELDQNVGAAEARNVAFKNAKGRYIAFLDCDDIWYPKKLQMQIDFMQEHKYAFTFTAYETISEDGVRELSTIRVPEKINYEQYCKNTIIGCLTVMVDRAKTGDFKMPHIKSSHDMALWLLLMRRGFDAYGLDEVLAKYRLVTGSNTAKKWEAAKDVWRVYRDIERLSLIESSWYFVNYVFNAIRKRV